MTSLLKVYKRERLNLEEDSGGRGRGGGIEYNNGAALAGSGWILLVSW